MARSASAAKVRLLTGLNPDVRLTPSADHSEVITLNTTADGPDASALVWAVNIVGDRWSLLTVSEIGRGVGRFNEIQRRTGIPRDRLALRLRHLEKWAVVARVPYCDHPPRFEYILTQAGRSVMPAIEALENWGRRYSFIQRAHITKSS